jgi:hypothetical protein
MEGHANCECLLKIVRKRKRPKASEVNEVTSRDQGEIFTTRPPNRLLQKQKSLDQ